MKTRKVHGIVVDSIGNTLSGVSVRLTTSKDTLLAITTPDGYYSFISVKGNDINLSYSILGFQIAYKFIPQFVEWDNIQVPKMFLKSESAYLKEVLINKYKPILYKQDTVQYNMMAFQFDRQILLEDALKKLPNILVNRDGSVYAYGKPISFVQVDGKKFFGGDVLTATRNLPADFIKSLQVIDYYGEKAEITGKKEGNSEKILNIILKDNRKKITFGQLTAGAGTKDRYLGSLGVNHFDNSRELSLVSTVNNSNTSIFSYGSPNGGEREQSSADLSDMADPADGLNTVGSIGASFSSPISDHVNTNGRYTFIRKRNVTNGNSTLQSIYGMNTVLNKEEYEISTLDRIHQLDWNFDIQLSPRDKLKITPKVSYSESSSSISKDRFIKNNNIVSTGNYLLEGKSSTPKFDFESLYVHTFKKEGRKLLHNITGNWNTITKDDHIEDFIHTTSFNQLYYSDLSKQLVKTRNENREINSELSFFEPVDLGGVLNISYKFNFTDIDSRRNAYNRLDSNQTGDMMDSLSLKYHYAFQAHRIGMSYEQEYVQKFKLNVGLAVEPIQLSGYSKDKDIQTRYDNVNFVPSASLRWKFSNTADLIFNYNGRNNQPNFYQIQPLVDNTNSQNIIVGNPQLKSEFMHTMLTKFRKSFVKSGQYLELSMGYDFSFNKIVTDKTIDKESTIQMTTFDNTDGYYDLKSYYLFSSPLLSDALQLNFSGNLDFYKNVAYVNEQKFYGGQLLFSQALQLRYSISNYFETELNGNFSLNKATYNYPVRDNVIARIGQVGLASKAYLSNHLTLGLELNQRFNNGFYTNTQNNNPTIINSYLEYTFLKNKQALIRFQSFDLLNQNTGFSRDVVGNDILDLQNQRLARYFMVSLNLRLQKVPK